MRYRSFTSKCIILRVLFLNRFKRLLMVSYKKKRLLMVSYYLLQFIGATIGTSDLQVQTENGQIGMPSNICCVIVEYCPGGALKSYLIKNRRKKLAFKVVVQLALDLARGLNSNTESLVFLFSFLHRILNSRIS